MTAAGQKYVCRLRYRMLSEGDGGLEWSCLNTGDHVGVGIAAVFFLSSLRLEEPERHSHFLLVDGNVEFQRRLWEADR